MILDARVSQMKKNLIHLSRVERGDKQRKLGFNPKLIFFEKNSKTLDT